MGMTLLKVYNVRVIHEFDTSSTRVRHKFDARDTAAGRHVT